MNPGYKINFYDNIDCEIFLLNEYGKEYLEIFQYIKDGPIKSDFWRVCILYKYGGIYSDIDIEYMVPFDDFIKDVDFASCISHYERQFNPHFIFCKKKENHILKKCIDEYVYMYRNKIEYSYWKWSVVTILNKILNSEIFQSKMLFDGIYKGNDENMYQFLKENYSNKRHNCTYGSKIILYNRYIEYSSEQHQFYFLN